MHPQKAPVRRQAMGAFSLVSVSGLHSWLVPRRDSLEEVISQLLSSAAYTLLRRIPERQIRSPAVMAVPGDQKGQRIAIWNSVGRMPALTLLALMFDPQITWL